MKQLFLVRGTSGSGKTTVTRTLAGPGDVVIANDDFMMGANGEYSFDWRRLDEVARKAEAETKRAMEQGSERIFVHNTFTTEKELTPYYDLARKYDYRVFSLIVENRHGGVSEHGTPESTTEKQRRRFDIAL